MQAIITGASRGLGKTMAFFLAEKGFNLHLIARNADRLESIKNEIQKKTGVQVDMYACDFSRVSSSEKLAKALKERISSLAIMINNAASFELGELEESSAKQAQQLFNINLMAAFNLTNALIPLLKSQGKGHVFNIGSIVTQHPRKDFAAYTISKFALKGYTEVLRDELKDSKVKVTEIIPGSINTSSWDGIDNVPKQEFIQPQEIADAIWLCYSNTGASSIESMVIRPLNRNF